MSVRFVAYHRVSTSRQGASGLGLAAQEHAIAALAETRGATVIASFTEVESGRVSDRPELLKALHLAKVTGATLAIAKLDRLSRNAAFLLTMRDSGAKFIAADIPEANDLTVGISLLLSVIINVMFFLGFPPVAQYVAQGLIIIAAVALPELIGRWRGR